MRTFIFAVVLVSIAFAGGSARAGTGGKTVSAAVTVTPGQTITTSTDQGYGVEFYKVALGFADLLTVGYGVPDAFVSDPQQEAIGLCLLPPGVDDFSVATTDCHSLGDPDATRAKLQYSYRAPKAGSYVLAVGIADCTTGFSEIQYPCDRVHAHSVVARPTPYVLRVQVHVYTALSLSAPASVKVGASPLFRGQLQGAPSAGMKVLVQQRQAGVWRPLASAATTANGSFSVRARIATRGKVQLRALFGGDATHQPCKHTLTLTVT